MSRGRPFVKILNIPMSHFFVTSNYSTLNFLEFNIKKYIMYTERRLNDSFPLSPPFRYV